MIAIAPTGTSTEASVTLQYRVMPGRIATRARSIARGLQLALWPK
jgi:hypothetical protein